MGECLREIGGYLELERSWGDHYHRGAVALNSGRGCILYLAELRSIRTVWVPDYMCDSVWNAFFRAGCELRFYRVGPDFRPVYDFEVGGDEWLFLCDYYGQLSDPDIARAAERSGGRLVFDGTQSFFRRPPVECDSMYTCRKWFGVADGGYVLTARGEGLGRRLPRDESRGRMDFVLGRAERPAGEFFERASENNELFEGEPAKEMSPITETLMRGIDYERVAERRRENWRVLDAALGEANGLSPIEPKVPFMYPLKVEGTDGLRRALAAERVYAPKLWPNVAGSPEAGPAAVALAEGIVPLPIDQRYGRTEMERVRRVVLDYLNRRNGEVETNVKA